MKFSISVGLLLSVLVSNTNASCGVVNFNYGSGSSLDDQRGNSDIQVNRDNSASCTVQCDSASGLELYVGYGAPGQTNKNNAEASNNNMNCGDMLEATNSNGENGFSYIVVAASYSNLRVECGCPTTDQTPGGGCFSGTDTVQVWNQGVKAMKDLQVGDKVLTSTNPDLYEPVYSFGHYHQTNFANFVQLDTSTKGSITLTPNHLIYTTNDSNNNNPIRADHVQKGDQLSSGTVTKTFTVSKQGFFMPLTPSGKILVNDIEASTYISMADYAPIQEHPLLQFWLSEHHLSHLWLTPFRMYCMGVRSNYCPVNAKKNVDGEEGIMAYLKAGKDLAEFALRQSFGVQVLIGVPVFVSLLALGALELITGPALAPLAILMLGFAVMQIQKSRQQKKKVA